MRNVNLNEELPPKSRIVVLDGLRALAIILVFTVHFFNRYMSVNYFVKDPYLYRFFLTLNSSVICVELFFIISGYLIFDLLKNRPVGFLSFMDRRFSRLFPAHLATTIYIVFIRGLVILTPAGFTLNVLFLAPLISNIKVYNDVNWSLAWEWGFYFLIFGVMTFFRKKSDWIIVSILCLASAFLASLNYLKFSNLHFPEFGRFVGFYFGIILYIAIENRNEILEKYFKKFLPLAIVILPLLALIWTYKAEEIKALPLHGFYFIIASVCFSVVTFDSIVNRGILHKIFSNIVLRYLGRISYSFYLIHSFVIREVLNRMEAAQSIDEIVYRYFFVLGITIVFSSMSYYLFEYYFLRRPIVASA